MKIDIATTKQIAKIVVARSVSGVVVTLIHNNTPVETKTQKVQLYVGAYVVGSMVADAATDHVNNKIDQIADAVRDFKKSRKSTDK